MIWLLLAAGVAWAFSSTAPAWNEAKAREAGCRLLAQWDAGAGAPVLGEPTPEDLAAMILAVLYGERAQVGASTQKRARQLAEQLLRGGCS